MFAKVDLGDPNENLHSDEEIRQTVSLARKVFSGFEGCFMTELSYSAELSGQEIAEWDAKLPSYVGDPDKWVDDVIVLDSTFFTDVFSSRHSQA